MQEIVDTDIKFIHTVRNPYDNVATMHKRALEHGYNPALMASVEDYISRCEMNARRIKRLEKGTLLGTNHETFVGDPKSSLRELCDFLGLGYNEDYLEDCASIMLKSHTGAATTRMGH